MSEEAMDKMSRIRKSYLVAAGIVIWLSGCWFIGQQRHIDRNADTIPDQPASIEFDLSDNEYGSLVRDFASDGYVKSATYFADEWPINFWNSEMDSLENDMEQIRNDGFDSIILVIPWREFQPNIYPISYNENAFATLDKVMRAAGNQGMNVYARIGYTWDYYNDANENIIDRFCGLLYDNQIQSAWYDYVATMYDTLSQYENFKEGFLTWEDFWGNLGICDDLEERNRLERAQQIEYGEWVEKTYGLDNYNERYGTQFSSYDQIVVPRRDDAAMYAMYEFYDSFLMSLLRESQKEFPNLSMEVRMDWDVTYNKDGELEYYKHTDTFPCADSDFTATMYGIPMGFENVGERVSYQEGLEKTEYIISQLRQQNDNKDIYIEQFIFADNTPAYQNNAQIKDDEVDEYLENVSEILLNYTSGYGIWTYRNYCANMIYNSQFSLEDEGWDCQGNTQFLTYENSNVCELGPNGVIFQSIPLIRNHFDNDEYKLTIYVRDVMQAGSLNITMGSEIKEVDVIQSGVIELNFNKNESFNLKIESHGSNVLIDDIRLYSQIQDGFLYDENGNELSCANSIRILNLNLQ